MRLEEMLGAPEAPVDTNVGSIPGQMTVEECVAEAEKPQFETATTPSGQEIYYQWAPKRLYRIGPQGGDWLANGDQGWVEVPSVTTVLGVLDKPALVFWGNGVGVDGVLELVARKKLMWVND